MKTKSRAIRGSAGKHAQIHCLGGEMSVSGALAERDILSLRDAGYLTIIDLRGAGEPIVGLASGVERQLAEAAGMAYEHIPMGGSPIDGSRINELRVALWAAEPKILMHCGNGRRAALCAMIHLGCQSGWTIDQCLDFALEHGVELAQMPAMLAYLKDYLRQHSRAYLDPAPVRNAGEGCRAGNSLRS